MIEIHELTGSYAVHALDPADQVGFEIHLATCPACREEVAELSAAAAELSLLSLATPPPTLRSKVLAVIRATPQLAALNGVARGAPSVAVNGSRPAVEWRHEVQLIGPRRAAPGSAVPAAEEESGARGDELARRRQRRRARVLSGLAAAMLALAVGLGGVTYSLVQQRQAQVAQSTLEQQLYSAPDAVTTTSALAGGGQVTFIASRQLNRAQFLGTDLPDPGQNRYQLWTATGTDPQNLTGVFRDVQVADTDPGIKVFFSGNVAAADFLAVNLEPVGSTPRHPRVPCWPRDRRPSDLVGGPTSGHPQARKNLLKTAHSGLISAPGALPASGSERKC